MVSRSNKFASYWIKDIQEHVKERSQEQREEWLSYKESFVHVFSNWKQNIGNKTGEFLTPSSANRDPDECKEGVWVVVVILNLLDTCRVRWNLPVHVHFLSSCSLNFYHIFQLSC